MRAIVTIVVALCISRACARAPFAQGGIRIVPPVRREAGPNHTYVLQAFNDGGTKLIKIIDARGKSFDVYFDHRLGTNTPGAIYLTDYPGKPMSVRVTNRGDFVRKLGVCE